MTGFYSRSKVLVITPRYILKNESSYGLLIK
jgi:hypothetical protein